MGIAHCDSSTIIGAPRTAFCSCPFLKLLRATRKRNKRSPAGARKTFHPTRLIFIPGGLAEQQATDLNLKEQHEKFVFVIVLYGFFQRCCRI